MGCTLTAKTRTYNPHVTQKLPGRDGFPQNWLSVKQWHGQVTKNHTPPNTQGCRRALPASHAGQFCGRNEQSGECHENGVDCLTSWQSLSTFGTSRRWFFPHKFHLLVHSPLRAECVDLSCFYENIISSPPLPHATNNNAGQWLF